MIVFKKSYELGKFLKTQIAQLNDASNSKHTNNIIVSAEEFDQMYLKDEETWNLVKDKFSPYQGRTHVIATYRHLHEIIVSYYYEKVVGRNIRKRWTSDIASFPTYWSQSDKKEFMLTDLIASFEQHSFNVSVFNYHEDSKSSDDLVTRFLCNLPHADATCEAYKTDTKSKGKDAAAVSRVSSKGYVHYDRIAKAASVKGMFQNYNPMLVKRYSVVQAIKYRVENDLGKTYTDLPQICLKKKEMSDILALSIQNGKSLLKDDFDKKELRK